MLWDSRVKFLLLICLVTGIVHKSSQNRCDLDEVCKDVETCDEAMFFISRNVDEIQKLRVCGSKANTVRSPYPEKMTFNVTFTERLLL